MFLSADEVRELTGRVRPKQQAAWLRARRIRHYVNAAGRVVVMREWLVDRSEPAPAEPDFAALERAYCDDG